MQKFDTPLLGMLTKSTSASPRGLPTPSACALIHVVTDRDIWESIRRARDNAKAAEEQEVERVETAENAEQQRSAGVRVAARQAVREALDDILGDS